MKKSIFKKTISLLSVLCLLLALSGCSMSEVSIDELMRPPQLSQSRQQVQSTVNQLLGNASALIAPTGGNHRSSINLADMNNDGQNDVICFFAESDTKLISVLLLQKQQDKWQEVGRFAGDATSVDKLEIADLDDDGTAELIIGWSYLTGSDRTLEVLRSAEQKLTSLYRGRYSQFEIVESKQPRIVSIDLSGDAATLLGFKGHKISPLSTVPIDPRISVFTAVTVSRTSAGHPALYLDAQLEDQSYHTEVLAVSDKEYLENKLFTDGTGGAGRPLNIRCTDIDGDGIPEIPRCAAMEQGEGASYYTYWSKFDGTELLEPLTTFTGTADSFYFIYPEKWIDTVFVRQDSAMPRLYHFVTRRGVTIYSLRVFTLNEFSQIHPGEGWISLTENTDKVIAYKPVENTAAFPFTTAEWAAALHTY